MFTTDTFSILAKRGMGEFDPPGTYRERGWRGEREPPARGPSGRSPGSSERKERARRPHPTSLSAVALALHRRERATKTRSGKQTFLWDEGWFFLYKLLSYNIIVYPIIHRFLHFFFSMKRKPALKEKSEGGSSPLYPLGRTGAELRQRPRGRISLPPPPPVRGMSREDQTLPSRASPEY